MWYDLTMDIETKPIFDHCAIVYIYAIVDPRTNNVRYIGQSKTPVIRMAYHMSTWWAAGYIHRSPWMAELEAAGLKPIQCILEIVPAMLGEYMEKRWIEHYAGIGPLFNHRHNPHAIPETADRYHEWLKKQSKI